MKYLNLLTILILTFVMNAGFAATIGDDVLKIGKAGSSANKEIQLGSTRKIRSNSSTGKIEFTNDGTIYKSLGSGSGGGAGAITIIDNGGFEDGVSVGWSSTASTVTAITGSSALIGATSAQFDPTSQNDFYRTSYFTVPKGLRGAACEARFLYTGSDRNVYAKVETESGVVLGTYINSIDGLNGIPAHSLPEYESVFYKCPTEADVTALSTNGNIRLVVYQGTVTNAALGVFDDVHFGGLIGLAESSSPDILSARIAATGSTVLKTNVPNWLTSTNGATGVYTLNWAGLGLTSAPNCTFSTDQAVSPNEIYHCEDNTASISATGVTVRCAGSSGTNINRIFNINCVKTGADAKQSVQIYKSIPKVSQNINSFSAKISSTGVVSDENTDWINGSCTYSSGSSTCTFVTSLFTVSPTCVASSQANRFIRVQAASTTDFSISTYNDSGVADNQAYQIICYKQGADFKLPAVQPIVVGQVTNSKAETALSNVRIEVCKANNSGTATIDTNSTMCSNWIQSVSRASAGTILFTFIPGVFSVEPVCTHSVGAQFQSGVSVNGTTSVSASAVTSTGSGSDQSINLVCVGKR